MAFPGTDKIDLKKNYYNILEMSIELKMIEELKKLIDEGYSMTDITYALKFVDKERERCRIKSMKYRETNPKPPSPNPPGRPRKNNKIDPEKNLDSGIPV
jgi:hypothetical protein